MPWRHTPLWITVGGSSLAVIAGYVNAAGFLGAQHGLTHVTGQVTHVGIDLARADLESVLRAASLVFWFFLGAAVSGMVIRRPELSSRGRRYGVVMLLEALLLTLATWVLLKGEPWALNLVTMAAGLQNAMATSYSGAVLRTTHMTGIVTDLGILLGQALRGHGMEWARVRLLVVLFTSFVGGGVLGAIAHHWLRELTLLPPAAALVLASAGYFYATQFRGGASR